MDPMEYLWITRSRAEKAARTARKNGLADRTRVRHVRYRDEQGYIIRLFDRLGDELGLLHPDNLTAERLQLKAAA